jgi:hypothetical protein
MHEDYEVKYWTKALGGTKDKLAKVAAKVGKSASAVRKESRIFRLSVIVSVLSSP